MNNASSYETVYFGNGSFRFNGTLASHKQAIVIPFVIPKRLQWYEILFIVSSALSPVLISAVGFGRSLSPYLFKRIVIFEMKIGELSYHLAEMERRRQKAGRGTSRRKVNRAVREIYAESMISQRTYYIRRVIPVVRKMGWREYKSRFVGWMVERIRFRKGRGMNVLAYSGQRRKTQSSLFAGPSHLGTLAHCEASISLTPRTVHQPS